ncbi:hypothetical protein SELMODRAFT_104878, partial [Selaginella moellendorffii]
FKGAMTEVSQLDHKALIEMHNYLTSVYEEGDARSMLIGVVQALHHPLSGVDSVSHTSIVIHFLSYLFPRFEHILLVQTGEKCLRGLHRFIQR